MGVRALLAAMLVVLALVCHVHAGDTPASKAGKAAPTTLAVLEEMLGNKVLGSRTPLEEVQKFTESRIRRMPEVTSAADWEKIAAQTRNDVHQKVVFRGEAGAWRDATTRVEWLEVLDTKGGYRIRKLRYEALPGLWIPALLYEPTTLKDKVPVSLHVNGHDGNGKSAAYKQSRCINFAKRGMLALNVEWLGMGQLATPGFNHYRMNQLDLCGTSGLAPFYLAMRKALDVLLAHAHADKTRVAVAGLSGGGWQTIVISSLDPRVTLANPVAGYSSFLTRVKHFSDLGDSEQTPVDLAATADYHHLTAMLGNRSLLLTYNAADGCCFRADHALPPLLESARPIFALHGRANALRSHINHKPGDHNFERDNREALYRMVGEQFYPQDKTFVTSEISCQEEIQTATALHVPLPAPNADFHTLALELSKSLPRNADIPANPVPWRRHKRVQLRQVLHAPHYHVRAEQVRGEERDHLKAVYWRFHVDDTWTIPAVDLTRGTPRGTTIVLADDGRVAAGKTVEQLLAAGQRVLAVDPFYFGESRISSHPFLFALLVSSVGERPLGIQASQLTAIANWASMNYGHEVTLHAQGPRTSLLALVAAALEPKAIMALQWQNPLPSLKAIIELNWPVNEKPELFCFGLLEAFDIPQLRALVAPRPITNFLVP